MNKRYDYRRKYKTMSLDELILQRDYNKQRFDQAFVCVGAEKTADEYWRHYTYLRHRVEKSERANKSSHADGGTIPPNQPDPGE